MKYIIMFLIAFNLYAGGCMDNNALRNKYIVNINSGDIKFLKDIDDLYCVNSEAPIFIFENKEQAIKYSMALKNSENLGFYKAMLFIGLFGLIVLFFIRDRMKGV